MGVQFTGNRQKGRAPTPQETQNSFGQKHVINNQSAAEEGQLTAKNVGIQN